MNESPMLADIVRETDSDVVLAARTWTLTDRSALADLLPAAQDRGVSVVVGGVLYGLALDGSNGRISSVCRRFGVSLLAAAIQFPLLHPAVSAVLVGMRSPSEAVVDIDAFSEPIPDGFWSALREVFDMP
jgi:D-threo-aldose 1-dehydrogenase